MSDSLPTSLKNPPTPVMESTFSEYFDTNYIPTDAEIDRIRAYLEPHEAELARLDSLMRKITIHREKIKDHIRSHRALISHPRRLPQDILEQIFLACLPTRHNAVMSPMEPPLLLGRICSAWRAVAFSMPRLWASLHISAAFFSKNDGRKAAVVDWLARSAPYPLSLSASYDWRRQENQSITDSLIQFSERWHSIRLSKLEVADFSSRLAAIHAPLLIDIDIDFGGGMEGDFTTVLSSSLIRGMQSRHITITGRCHDELIPETPFKWDHLTHLTLLCKEDDTIGLAASAAYDLLKGCTRLIAVRLRLQCDHELHDQNMATTPLLHPSLESFIIVGLGASPSVRELVNLVNHLEMPRLRQFHLRNLQAYTALRRFDIVILRHLAERSPLICDLNLTFVDLTGPNVVETLQLFPNVSKLHLVYLCPRPGSPWLVDPDAAAVLSLIIANPTTPNPCPALKQLTTQGMSFDNELLVDLLRKQPDLAPNLERLELILLDIPPNGLPDLEPFLDRGLVISVRTAPPVEGSAWVGIEA
ncbi:hypothetical protein DFH06DRAFT_1247803 [Mycena polygramma]|nr:hypothetical protein DFH06DRAFT_1247803 [Mycena polygramma]